MYDTKYNIIKEISPDYYIEIYYTYEKGDDPIYEGSNGGYPGSSSEVSILQIFAEVKDDEGNKLKVDVKPFLENLDEDSIYDLENKVLEEHECE